MKIKTRLLGLGIAAALGTVGSVGMAEFMAMEAEKLSDNAITINELEKDFLHLRAAEKQFQLEHLDSQLVEFQTYLQIIDTDYLALTKKLGETNGFEHKVLVDLLNKYSSVFEDAIEWERKKGDAEKEMSSKNLSAMQRMSVLQNLRSANVYLGVGADEGIRHDVNAVALEIQAWFDGLGKRVDAEITKQKDVNNDIELAFGVGILALMVLLIIFSVSTINKQVVLLRSDLERRVSDNDITEGKVDGVDAEFVEILESLNALFASVREVVQKSQGGSTLVSDMSREVASKTTELSDSSNEIADSAERIALTTHELTSTVHEIAETTQLAAEKAASAQNEANDGKQSVDEAMENLGSLSNSLSRSESDIAGLSDLVEKIVGSVGIIQGIAEQTNLLALNAAIEAARAGEQGRGFAVVADEVRTLASSTQNSTKEITDLVTEIQLQMERTVESMRENAEVGQVVVAKSGALGDVLGGIISGMEVINAQTQQVAAAVEEQGVSIGDIAQRINSVSEQTKGNLDKVIECDELAQSINKNAADTQSAVSKIKT
ncbi:methyl-accepting chemotaxis protein [Vibrio crassostreae]|uniref:methyl-accepting chemotaxis protein n=1 Tax=Vibrio crassostreae TaxID=246167 RepID=UPI001B3174FC|nr:methyl-accepting chemotaxis protein [Vibrio crassostreae]